MNGPIFCFCEGILVGVFSFFLSFLLFSPFFLLAVVVSGVDGNGESQIGLGYLERVKLVLKASGQAFCFANSAMEASLSGFQQGRGD
jgi:hypothetical protein